MPNNKREEEGEGNGDGLCGGSSGSSRGATGATLVAETKALSGSQLRMLRC
jgi:hypothetical protein